MARRNPPGTLQAIRETRKEDSTARVLVLTVSDADSDVRRSREAGALGYAIKDTPTRELFEGIRRVEAGHSYSSGEVASRLYLSPEDARGSSLSTEQLRVLLLTANGKRTKGIARELHASERTVEPRLKEGREKLRVETNAQAVAQARKTRLIRVDDV